MLAHERHEKIVALLKKHHRMEVRPLQVALGVSSATLRRDLTFLEQIDRVVRVHGGVCHPSAVSAEPSYLQRASLAVQSKRAIAKAVARRIPQAATVFIDSGTTCLEAGRLIRSRADLTIITNSLPLIATYDQFASRLLVLGGELRSASWALVGNLTRSASVPLRADIALIGASSLHVEDGAGTTELLECEVKQDWIARSRQTFLLADASKWEASTPVTFACWDKFDVFFTDKRPPAIFRRKNLQTIYP